MNDKISLSIPTKSEYVSVARLTSSVIANNMGFDIEEIEDIKVAVGEACNNAVLHTHDVDHTFDLSFFAENEKLIIEVKDSGKGFALDSYREPDLENPKEHGLGIFIMKSLMDDLKIDSEVGKGTFIRMTKYLNR
ncbi:MAG: ATP-binding protein [Clostridia bacterium]|nr:ATP-binding protein [Clostridia bacterium]